MMNWSDLFQLLDKILSAGGKKAENLYRVAITVLVILILYNLFGMKKEQAASTQMFSNKLDSVRIEFVVYKEQEAANWKIANNNFQNVDDKFKKYDLQLVSYDQQIAAVRDNVFAILRSRTKMEMR